MFYQKLQRFVTNLLLILIALPLTQLAGVLAWLFADYVLSTTIMIAVAMALMLSVKSIE
jgi:hypothetical protein